MLPLLLTLLTIAPAFSAPQPAELAAEGPAEGPALLVFWSLERPDSAREIRAILALAASTGRAVVLVNTDGASYRSRLRPFLAAHGIDAASLSDADGALRRRFHVQEEAVLALNESGQVAWREEEGFSAEAMAQWLGVEPREDGPLVDASR